MSDGPRVFLFHGDDDTAIQESVTKLQDALGEPTTAAMNTTRFDLAPSLEELRGAAMATPFLAKRRLVVVSGATKAFSAADPYRQLIEFLETEIPETTAIIFLEPPLIEKKKGKHKFLKWAESKKPLVEVAAMDLPQGAQMAAWIRDKAKVLGGEFEPLAAEALEKFVGSSKGSAENEIEKLLAFVAYKRPVKIMDVDAVSQTIGEQGDYFALADALSAGNSAKAMELLQPLLLERELIMLYFSLVSHFRLLLESREMVEAGQNAEAIAAELGIHPYRAQKMAEQARRFSLSALEKIYHRLLELDEEIKTGELSPELAMELFVAGLTAQKA